MPIRNPNPAPDPIVKAHLKPAATSYGDKLRDPRWQKRRLEVMNRDHFRCRLCHDDKTTLNVHHIMYTPGEPWDEPMENLLTTCENCHGIIQHCKTPDQYRCFQMILQGTNLIGNMVANGWDYADLPVFITRSMPNNENQEPSDDALARYRKHKDSAMAAPRWSDEDLFS